MTPRAVCVVGAGASGLVAARHLVAAGFEVDVLEREDDLGGNWNYGKPGARVYRSTHTISSKPGTEFPDFPMPAELPDYPHHTQVLDYLRAYARHFDLERHVAYGVEVARVEPERPGGRDTPWRVTTRRAADGREETRGYDAVVIANGHNWSPKLPSYPGEFAGETMHSATYRTPELFAGKRVLVVGGGNTGCDLAVEAAQHAVRAYHSTRRGYHYVPKYLLGRPSDQVGDLMHRLRLPLAVRRAVAGLTIRLVVGDLRAHGLPAPDLRLFESHPVVNTLLPYYVRHGDVVAKPDVARLDGRVAHFADGSSAEVDLIVFATGYRVDIPFVAPEQLNWRDGRPRLYKHVFHPAYDTLFVAGLIQPDSGQFGLVHWQTLAVARFLRAALAGHPAADWLRRRKGSPHEPLGGGIAYTESTRHHLEVEHWSYRKGLREICERLGSADR